MVKDASLYSMYWRIVKYTPSKTVINRRVSDLFFFPFIKKWWAAVSVIPDLNKIRVFIRGIPIGLNDLIPLQGHICPMKISGDNEQWKNAQKNDKKKNTSDVINNIIPSFNPIMTSFVCLPSKVDSRIMSRHHLQEINTIKNKFIIIIKLGIFPLNNLAVVKTILKTWNEARIGQGLRVTKWNGIFGIFF